MIRGRTAHRPPNRLKAGLHIQSSSDPKRRCYLEDATGLERAAYPSPEKHVKHERQPLR